MSLVDAISENNLDSFVKLLEKLDDCNFHILDYAGYTPLHLAVWHNRVEMVRLLLEKGANVDLKTEYRGHTPLMFACFNITITKLLLKHGANINEQNDEGWTVLHYACLDKRYDVIKELLNWNVDLTLKNSHNLTVFDLSVKPVIEFIQYYQKTKQIGDLWEIHY